MSIEDGTPDDHANAGTVLVVGGAGFLGGYVVAALRRRGWRVLRGVRANGRALADDERSTDLATVRPMEQWLPVLQGVDVVINMAGILRQTSTQRFETIHHLAPLSLARACVRAGVRRFVQVSALGLAEDGEFVASKHRFDQALSELPLSSVVLRPSVVYSVSGSYGGTSLLRALAAMPAASWLPGNGAWPLQPLAVEDLAELVVRAAEGSGEGSYEVGGPRAMSLREYQSAWRAWLRLPGERFIRTPLVLVNALVGAWERLGSGPIGATMWRMLQRGNVTGPDAGERLHRDFGFVPRALEEVLSAHPSQVQDRWHAQLYFLAPALRAAVVALCLLSAWAGATASPDTIIGLASGSWLEHLNPVLVARMAAALDLMLGLWLLTGVALRPAIVAVTLAVAVYTMTFGTALPSLWLDPLGGLAKNLVVLPALAVLWVLSDRR